MTERTDVEKNVRRLIASDVEYRVLKSLGEKGVRRLDKQAKTIAGLLKDKAEVGERIFARVVRSDEEKARTLREGIDAFKQKHPNYGEELEGCISEKRVKHNRTLVYGLQPGYKLAEEDYVQVMMDLGFDKREASSMYPHIIAISDRLDRASEQSERQILLS